MLPLAKIWGSQSLTGAVPMGYRMPAFGGYSTNRIAQWKEHQALNLTVAGSNPVTKPISLDRKSSRQSTPAN